MNRLILAITSSLLLLASTAFSAEQPSYVFNAGGTRIISCNAKLIASLNEAYSKAQQQLAFYQSNETTVGVGRGALQRKIFVTHNNDRYFKVEENSGDVLLEAYMSPAVPSSNIVATMTVSFFTERYVTVKDAGSWYGLVFLWLKLGEIKLVAEECDTVQTSRRQLYR